MYFGTYHWLPLVNGYTAYEPPSHRLLFLLAERLPDPASFADLVDLSGARLLLLHRDRGDSETRARWTAWLAGGRSCDPLAEFGADLICALPSAREDLRPALVAADEHPPRRTFRGQPLAPLPDGARDGRLVVREAGGTVAAGLVTRIRLEATNLGSAPWPGLAPLVPGVVAVRHRWEAFSAGAASETAWEATPILCDVAPGRSCMIVLPVSAPPTPGRYTLALTLAQDAGPALRLEGGEPVRIPMRVVPLRGGEAS
jgi:hypothetical protein